MLDSVLSVSSLEESKYLLEHLYSLAKSKGFDCTQKDTQYRELSAQFEKLRLDSRLREQLMEQLLQDSGVTLAVNQEGKSLQEHTYFN